MPLVFDLAGVRDLVDELQDEIILIPKARTGFLRALDVGADISILVSAHPPLLVHKYQDVVDIDLILPSQLDLEDLVLPDLGCLVPGRSSIPSVQFNLGTVPVLELRVRQRAS